MLARDTLVLLIMKRLNHNYRSFKLLLVLLLTSPPLWAQLNTETNKNINPMEQAQLAFNQGRHIEAVRLWHSLAKDGHTEAQVLLGLAYVNAWGLKRDTKKAEHWYLQAAQAKSSSAQFLLGLMLITSDSGKKAEQGLFWLKQAEKNGNIMASEFLNNARKNQWLDHIQSTLVQANQSGS